MNPWEIMLAELESNRLVVVLVPCKRRVNEGGCIRVATEKNCKWYRVFCARHLSDRKRRKSAVDTRIKRANIISILSRLAGEKCTNSKYFLELDRIRREYFPVPNGMNGQAKCPGSVERNHWQT